MAVCPECVGMYSYDHARAWCSSIALPLIALRPGLSVNQKLAILARLSSHQALGIHLSLCLLKLGSQACAAVSLLILELVVQTQVCILVQHEPLPPESAPQPWKGFPSDIGGSSRASVRSLCSRASTAFIFWQARRAFSFLTPRVLFPSRYSKVATNDVMCSVGIYQYLLCRLGAYTCHQCSTVVLMT